MLESGHRVSLGANELGDEFGKVFEALLQVWNTSQLFVEQSKERSTLGDFQSQDSSRMVDTDDTEEPANIELCYKLLLQIIRFHAQVVWEQAYERNQLLG